MKISTRDLVQIAIFAALTAVGAFIRIPLPLVPFTLQIFFCALAGVLLGSKKGMFSQLLYVLIGLTGIPVFTAGGGISYVLKPTFGYLIGFIVATYVMGLMAEKLKTLTTVKIFAIMALGLFIIYLIGVPYLYLINNFYVGKAISLWLAIYNGCILFIGGNLISLYIAAVISVKLLPILKKAGLLKSSPAN